MPRVPTTVMICALSTVSLTQEVSTVSPLSANARWPERSTRAATGLASWPEGFVGWRDEVVIRHSLGHNCKRSAVVVMISRHTPR